MIKLSVHPLFWIVFILAFLHGFLYEVLMLFTIVIIHELGHACTAKSLGWRVTKIQLLPFGGVAEMEEYGNKPLREEFLVLVAGPLMNVLMMLVSFLLWMAGLWSETFAMQFLEYNVLMLAFNLLPILPLDGGKILQLFFCLFMSYKRAIRLSLFASIGCLIVYLTGMIIFVPYYFALWIIAGFLIIVQWLEYKQSPYKLMRFLMERKKVHEQHATPFENRHVLSLTVSAQRTVKEVIELMVRNKWHYFCLVSQQGKLQRIVAEDELLDAYFKSRQSTSIGEL